jgi:hypothetical protein
MPGGKPLRRVTRRAYQSSPELSFTLGAKLTALVERIAAI